MKMNKWTLGLAAAGLVSLPVASAGSSTIETSLGLFAVLVSTQWSNTTPLKSSTRTEYEVVGTVKSRVKVTGVKPVARVLPLESRSTV